MSGNSDREQEYAMDTPSSLHFRFRFPSCIRHALCLRYLLHNLIPELFKMDLIELLGEEPATPCSAVYPVNDLLDHKQDLLLGLDREQAAPDLRVPPAPATDCDEVVAVLGLDKIKVTRFDAHTTLDTFAFVQDRDTIPDTDRILLAVVNAVTTPGAEPLFRADRHDTADDADLVEHGARAGIRAAGEGDPHLDRHLLAEELRINLFCKADGIDIGKLAPARPGACDDVDDLVLLGTDRRPVLLQPLAIPYIKM